MKVRTKKLLSILLAASMVFSMNTFAFGEEKVSGNTDAVLLTTGPQKSISSDCFYWNAIEDEEYMAKYFLDWEEASEAGEKKHFDSDHLIDGKPVTVSYNYGDYDAQEAGYDYSNLSYFDRDAAWEKDNEKKIWKFKGVKDAYFYGGVSSNVFKLDDTHYLMVAYKLYDWIDLNAGTNVPVVAFNGKKYVDTSKAPDNGKIDKNNSTIYAEAALVEQTPGNAPVLLANSMSNNKAGKPMINLTIKPKNNLHANVSMNDISDKDGKWLGYQPIENVNLKSGAYPYFTISVKLDKELKDQKKNLKKSVDIFGATLPKAEFKFDICRNCFAWADFTSVTQTEIETTDHNWNGDLGFRHVYPNPNFRDIDDYDYPGEYSAEWGEWIAERYLRTDNKDIGYIDLFTDATKVGKNGLSAYLINTEGEYVKEISSKGWSKKKNYLTYKLKNKKDYEVSELMTDVYLFKPIGDFEGDGVIFRNAKYTVPAGQTYNGKVLKKDTEVSELRMGIYNAETNHWYCDSVD